MIGQGDLQAARVRVLIVDDSALQRQMLTRLLAADPEIEVVGWASNGQEAVSVAPRLRPSVISMDLHMPVMDGLEASRRIMEEAPAPIVLVTASPSAGEQRLAFAALEAGALAVVRKPWRDSDGTIGTDELLRTIKTLARVPVIHRKPAGRSGTATNRPEPARLPAQHRVQIIAIGASTGGPLALRDILAELPAHFPLPVLVVQHIAEGFETGLVEWLQPHCAIPICLAEDGGALDRPGVLVSPCGRHLMTHGRHVRLSDDPPISWHRPSATALFRSVAREYGPRAIGVLLTGMGDDGALGLGEMKGAGAVTIAQDEESCVIFGMPGVAVRSGAVDHVLPPASIGRLVGQLGGAAE